MSGKFFGEGIIRRCIPYGFLPHICDTLKEELIYYTGGALPLQTTLAGD